MFNLEVALLFKRREHAERPRQKRLDFRPRERIEVDIAARQDDCDAF
jgi:hypothetical protein